MNSKEQELFSRGIHYEIYNSMGAKLWQHKGIKGVKFSVWAPCAKGISVIGDFNFWDGKKHPMKRRSSSGIWDLFIPGIEKGCLYKFEIEGADGSICQKADPYAVYSEKRPRTASIVWDVNTYTWQDHDWMERRKHEPFYDRPLNIYEVHIGSWKKHLVNYRDIAHELAAYVKEMGYTHIELLPILEHPLDESWGYQVSGFFAVTSRHGAPEDFQYFVDHMHQNGIGVLLDWVPAHFATDGHALARFDGTCLYEHADPKKGFHPHWQTFIFNYGRYEVSNFLIASALFWFDKMHIDGLRVDAVASMLYLDYGRKEGEWVPNFYGGKENLEALEFIKHLNSIVHDRFPGVLMIAEESTSFFGVSHPLESGGLGFDLKWNLGWMNDTIRYFQKDPIYRKYHQNDLTFSLLYAFHERFMLVLSHDEVVHGKGSLLQKMPGDHWQRFANLRLLYGYKICHPGKKLLFMGGEFGQGFEWHCKDGLFWHMLDYESHRGVQTCVKELNHFYLSHPSLWEIDFDWRGFQWIDFSDHNQSIISFLRFGKTGKPLACICNFTPQYYERYFIHLKNISAIHEIFNTDREVYGGSNKLNRIIDFNQEGFHIQMAPLATMVFEVEFK